MPKKYFKNYSLKTLCSYLYAGTDLVIYKEEDGYYAYPIVSASSYVCRLTWDGKREYPLEKISSLHWTSVMSKREIYEALKQITY